LRLRRIAIPPADGRPKIKVKSNFDKDSVARWAYRDVGRQGTSHMDIVERCFVAAAAASLLLIAATAWFELS